MFTEKVAVMHTLELAPNPSNESGVAKFEFQSHGDLPLRQMFVTWDLEGRLQVQSWDSHCSGYYG